VLAPPNRTDKKRRTIPPAKMSVGDGEALKRWVEDLAANQPLSEEIQVWLSGIAPELLDKLAAVGLVQKGGAAAMKAHTFTEADREVCRRNALARDQGRHLTLGYQDQIKLAGIDITFMRFVISAPATFI